MQQKQQIRITSWVGWICVTFSLKSLGLH